MPKRLPAGTHEAVSRRLQREIDDLRLREGMPGADGSAGPVGPMGPPGPTGATGATGAAGSTGAVGPAGLASIGTPVTPTRALATNFVPDATRPMLVGYAFQLHTVLTAIGTSFAQVQLLADAGAGTPTTVRSTTRHQRVLGLGISINEQSDVISSVYAMIPAGWTCRLVATTGNGGTVTSIAQTEVPLQP